MPGKARMGPNQETRLHVTPNTDSIEMPAGFPVSYHLLPLNHKDTSERNVTQSCPTLCDPLDYTVHGILQARILEWVAFPFSRESSHPGTEPTSPTLQADSLLTEP